MTRLQDAPKCRQRRDSWNHLDNDPNHKSDLIEMRPEKHFVVE